MKWENISYKKKCIIVVGSTVFMLIIAILSPLKRTINVINEKALLDIKVENAKNAPKKINQLQKKVDEWSKDISINITSDNIQTKLFEEISNIVDKNKVVLKSVNLIREQIKEDIKVQYFMTTIEGSYNKLLMCISESEQNIKLGKIVSLKLFKSKNKKRNEILQTQFIIQSISKK